MKHIESEPIILNCDIETGLLLTEKQAIKCWHLINLFGRGLTHPETSGQAVSLYLPKSIVAELKTLIREIDKFNE